MSKNIMDVEKVILQYLESVGADGLVNVDAECGCCVAYDGLAPCGEIGLGCEVAWKGPAPEEYEDESDYGMWATKPEVKPLTERMRKIIGRAMTLEGDSCYRRRIGMEPNDADYPMALELVEAGLLEKERWVMGWAPGEEVFHVTLAGRWSYMQSEADDE